MSRPEPADGRQSPVGVAGVACFGSLAVIHLATQPFLRFLDPWGIQWLLEVSFPVAVAFIILYRNSWHEEMSGLKRVLPMILRAGIVYGVVLMASALVLAVAGVFFSNGMVSG